MKINGYELCWIVFWIGLFGSCSVSVSSYSVAKIYDDCDCDKVQK